MPTARTARRFRRSKKNTPSVHAEKQEKIRAWLAARDRGDAADGSRRAHGHAGRAEAPPTPCARKRKAALLAVDPHAQNQGFGLCLHHIHPGSTAARRHRAADRGDVRRRPAPRRANSTRSARRPPLISGGISVRSPPTTKRAMSAPPNGSPRSGELSRSPSPCSRASPKI